MSSLHHLRKGVIMHTEYRKPPLDLLWLSFYLGLVLRMTPFTFCLLDCICHHNDCRLLSLSKSSQHSVFIEINEIKKISTWERLTMSVLIFRTIMHLHIHLDDKSCWFTLTTETYLTIATHSIKLCAALKRLQI